MYIYEKYPVSRRRKSRRRRQSIFIPTMLSLLLISAFICLCFFCIRTFKNKKKNSLSNPSQSSSLAESEVSKSSLAETINDNKDLLSDLLTRADKVAKSYDYDAAIELLQNDTTFANNEEVLAAISNYENAKSSLIRQDISKITHIFFHTLIVDTSKAFDGDSKEAGYNEVMSTVDEFKKILQSMYDRGYVLVKIHDIAYEEDDGNGGKKMVEGNIMLPEGKKAFVMSQDDVCYYEYMVGDGFASRLVIGDDGRVITEMDMDDGSKKIGDYDLIPILNKFIDEHPDFSYKGAKAIIAVTGYNGVFGYRTDASYEGKNPNIAEDRQKVSEIATALKADGFELASHSWGHRHLGRIPFEEFKTDTDKWESNVESLIGDTDTILFPFGTDVSDWHPYTDSNERYIYLRDKGFRYFCTVDSNQYWVQVGKDYLRQGRRNLDGYRMWRDITEPDNPRISDLFDVNKVFDKARPTPVGVIRS